MANITITIGKDVPLFGTTVYIKEVRTFSGFKQIVTTSDKTEALHFDSIVAAEHFASEHNISLFDVNDPSDNTCEKYTIFC